MSNQDRENCIQLSFPVNAAYVSSARLTASSIANRINFDIDEIEDIKTAVSEACTYIIKSLPTSARNNFVICFYPGERSIEIDISTQGKLSPIPDDMSIMMIKAVVDKFEIKNDTDGRLTIHMTKTHKDFLNEPFY